MLPNCSLAALNIRLVLDLTTMDFKSVQSWIQICGERDLLAMRT